MKLTAKSENSLLAPICTVRLREKSLVAVSRGVRHHASMRPEKARLSDLV